MKKITVVLVVALVACSPKVTLVPDLDRVVTVAEFVAQEPLRKKVFDYCTNNPGQMANDANCINAIQATRMTSAGTGNFPRVVP